MASFERDVSSNESEAKETRFISLLSLADDDPYRATSGDPGPVKGYSRTRWVLAGAMLATVAAIGAVVVPSGGDDSQLNTTDGESAADAPATSAPAPLLDYNGAGPSTTVGSSTTAAADQAAAATTVAGTGADTSASSVLSGATGASTVTPSASSPSTVAGTSGSTATTAKGTTTASTAKPTSSTTAKPTTTAAPTSTAPPSNPGSGCWNLVVQDDFNGSSVDGSKWVEYNGSGHGGHGQRSSSALSVSGGMLTITASMQNGTLVSGGLGGRHNQTYGRYEARVRTDADPSETMSGLLLTWPQSGDQYNDGENDYYETTYTPGDRHEFYSFIHKPGAPASEQDYTVHSASASEWHTMVMEWRADKIVIYRDGQVIKTLNEDGANRIPDVAHFAAIQLDAFKDSLPNPVSMQVDYIKVFEAC